MNIVNMLTKDERKGLEQKLIDELLYRKKPWGTAGISFPYISDTYYVLGIFNPWDLFEFCNINNIYLRIRRHPNYDANMTYSYTYSGIKLRKIEIEVRE